MDAISSSGYYPIDVIEENFIRIRQIAEKYNKPFFFIESGCPAREGSEMQPYDWSFKAPLSLQAQARWYAAFCDALLRHPWVRGSVWWDWPARLYPPEKAENDGYCMYGKPAAEVLQHFSAALYEREKQQMSK